MNKKTLSVRQACNCLSVSECGYYKWKRNQDRPKSWEFVLRQIHTVLDEHTDNDNYGVQRMKQALAQRGIKRSYATVKRAMLKGNLLHDSTRSPDGLTKAEKNVMRPENVIQRNFVADEPNRKWLTDITQVVCRDGKLHIAPVFDCFGGEVVSLAMDTKMSKQLCITAVVQAYDRRKPGSGVIIHSDAGSQYTSMKYRETLGAFHAVQSMGVVGKCYDNARMESWFATLKKEKLYRLDTLGMTVEQVKTEVWRYTFAYYNTVRVGGCTFIDFSKHRSL